MMKKWLWTVTLFLLLAGNVSAQTFQARVNRSEIPEGETFMLTLELDDAQTQDTPDLQVLDKDFTIYSVSNAYRTHIINGNYKQSRQWNLVLMPKNSGEVIIPAVKVDQYQSNPLVIKVAKAGENISPQNPQKPNEPRFRITGNVDNPNPYVQQQINYVLTIYDTGGLQGDEPVFLTNDSDQWIIKNLGEPQISTKTINGKNIREIKFNYALFPQKSGKLQIPAVKFNGFYLTRERRNDPFGNFFSDDTFIAGFGMADVFATRNPVVLSTQPIEITVKPIAAENNGNWWLPATNVNLYAEFNPAQPVFKAGEAVSRTIYLKADGVIDSQLPEIKFAQTADLKQYPEKPQTQMKVENGKVVSLEKITNVYIPSKAGIMKLPPLEVNWFNVNTGQMEKASLPAMTVTVEGSALSKSLPEAPTTDAATPQEEIRTSQSEKIIENINPYKIYWLLAAAFILGLAFSFLLMKLFNKKNTGKIRNYKKYIIEKAREKDLRGLRDALLGWAADYYQNENITTLKDIENLNDDPQFECELEKLTEALYDRSNKDWKSGSFVKVFEKVAAKKYRKKTDDEPLPKLYQ